MISESARCHFCCCVRVPELINQRIFQTGLFLNIHMYIYSSHYICRCHTIKNFDIATEKLHKWAARIIKWLSRARESFTYEKPSHIKKYPYDNYTEGINLIIYSYEYCSPLNEYKIFYSTYTIW